MSDQQTDAPAETGALIEPSRRTPEELTALARQYVQHEIYIGGTNDDLAMVFMPLALGGLAGWDLEKIGLVFEEISKAGPRSINGRPCFFSCQFLHIDDLEPFTAEVKRMAEALGLPT